MKKRYLAAILTLCLLVGVLAGCGNKETNTDAGGQTGTPTTGQTDAAQQSAFTYLASYTDVATDASSMYNYCVSGKYAYAVSEVYTEQASETPVARAEAAEETAAVEDTAVAEDMPVVEDTPVAPDIGFQSGGTSKTVIYQIDLETGTSKQLDSYQPSEVPEGWEGNSYISSLCPGADGSVWVCDQCSTYRYNLPENFDAASDDMYNYYEDGGSSVRLQQFDAAGKLLQTVTPGKTPDGDLMQNLLVDKTGNVFATDWMNIYVLAADGTIASTLELGENGGNLQLFDGQACVMSYDADITLRKIDPVTLQLGEPIAMPTNASSPLTSTDEAYDFCYVNSGVIYGYKLQEKQTEKIVDWLDCDVNSNELAGTFVLDDGRILGFQNLTDDAGNFKCQLVFLTKTDSASVKQKTVLTLACMYLDWDLRNRIVAFNKSHDDVRITVNDYSQYATNDDYNAGITKLNTEIISGKVPDLLYTSQMPIAKYAAKGVLLDLLPLIDGDQELSREKLMMEVLNAASIDGKLYQAFPSFYIYTAVGLDKVVGGYDSWTLANLQDAMTKLQPDATVFSVGRTKADVLSNCISRSISSFVNWETGACSFDSQEFKDLLRFVDSFPKEFDWEKFDYSDFVSDQQQLKTGMQLLIDTQVGDLNDYLYQLVMNNEPVDFVGYPTQSGSGNTFGIGDGLCISASCKNVDAAWSFVRTYFTKEYQSGGSFWGFPTNAEVFQKKVDDMMTPTYETDENGQQVLLPKVDYYIDENTHVTIDVMTQAQLDQLMALYHSAKTVYSYDQEILSIITDETQALFAGEKSVDDTASMIQNRVNLYVAEQS